MRLAVSGSLGPGVVGRGVLTQGSRDEEWVGSEEGEGDHAREPVRQGCYEEWSRERGNTYGLCQTTGGSDCVGAGDRAQGCSDQDADRRCPPVGRR